MIRLKHVIASIGLLMAATIALTGCNGGGGSVHVPPVQILYDQPTHLQIELTAWGSPPLSGKLSRRYTDVRMHYKTEKSPEYTIITAKVESEKNKRLLMSFDLPALTPADGAYVEYFIDMKFDGVYNKRDVVRVPLGLAPVIRYDANRLPCTLRTGELFHVM